MEQTDQSFIDTMRDVAKGISINSGFCTSDNLRVWASGYGLSPKDPHSWGCIFRSKGWQIIGYQPSALPSNHHRRIAIWKWEG